MMLTDRNSGLELAKQPEIHMQCESHPWGKTHCQIWEQERDFLARNITVLPWGVKKKRSPHAATVPFPGRV